MILAIKQWHICYRIAVIYLGDGCWHFFMKIRRTGNRPDLTLKCHYMRGTCLFRVAAILWPQISFMLGRESFQKLAKIKHLQVWLTLSFEGAKVLLVILEWGLRPTGLERFPMVKLYRLILAFWSENRHMLNTLMTAWKGCPFHLYSNAILHITYCGHHARKGNSKFSW